LISTGKDGSLCIWHWDPESNEFGSEPLKFNERQRVGDQLLCSAFSPGGSFLVTGGTDHTVRVYRVNPPPSQQIAELHGHTVRLRAINKNLLFSCKEEITCNVIKSFECGCICLQIVVN
jgi:WD40 repeat protein